MVKSDTEKTPSPPVPSADGRPVGASLYLSLSATLLSKAFMCADKGELGELWGGGQNGHLEAFAAETVLVFHYRTTATF